MKRVIVVIAVADNALACLRVLRACVHTTYTDPTEYVDLDYIPLYRTH